MDYQQANKVAIGEYNPALESYLDETIDKVNADNNGNKDEEHNEEGDVDDETRQRIKQIFLLYMSFLTHYFMSADVSVGKVLEKIFITIKLFQTFEILQGTLFKIGGDRYIFQICITNVSKRLEK